MLAPVTNSRLQWRTSAVFSTSGPTIIPGVSTSVMTGSPNASHSCRKRAALSAPVAVDRAGEVVGVVGEHADRAALDASERGDHAEPEVAAQLEHRALVEHRVDDRAHVVAALAVLGDRTAQAPLVGRDPGVPGPGSTRGTAWRRARLRPRRAHDVDHAVGALHVDRADLGGLEHAEPAAFDHRRAAHADVRVLGGDHDVAAAEDRRVAGEAVAALMPTSGTSPLSSAKYRNARQSRPLTPVCRCRQAGHRRPR
jgi:hypothetical protein